MPKIESFEQNVDRYEAWFEHHRLAYESELQAIRMLLPEGGEGLEVGVGTGRFAAPLDIGVGVEPCPAMGKLARERGIEGVQSKVVAGAMPTRKRIGIAPPVAY